MERQKQTAVSMGQVEGWGEKRKCPRPTKKGGGGGRQQHTTKTAVIVVGTKKKGRGPQTTRKRKGSWGEYQNSTLMPGGNTRT